MQAGFYATPPIRKTGRTYGMAGRIPGFFSSLWFATTFVIRAAIVACGIHGEMF